MKAFRSLSATLILVAALLFGMMPAGAFQAAPASRSYLIYAFVASVEGLSPALIAGLIRGVSGVDPFMR